MRRLVWHVIYAMIAIVALAVPTWAAGADVEESVVPFHYASPGNMQVPVYSMPGNPVQMTPARYLVPRATWVSIKEELQVDGQAWYRVGRGEYVLANDVVLASPSLFRGLEIDEAHRRPVGFVVSNDLNVRARPGVAPDNPPLAQLPRYAVVDILSQATAHDGVWYEIAPERYVHSRYIRVITPVTRPTAVDMQEKWIAVNLEEQALVAYEGDRMVYATLVSTGMPWWRTPEGLFRIWAKVRTGVMTGGSVEAGSYYYLQDVPWTMYFYRSYGLHAAYWHDGFGYPHSRGCINLSPRDAKWLFDWTSPVLAEDERVLLSSGTNPGTWVYVYSTAAAVELGSPISISSRQ
jgi:lipoprotein-anchoring transpeptidase ErfK/SrfK